MPGWKLCTKRHPSLTLMPQFVESTNEDCFLLLHDNEDFPMKKRLKGCCSGSLNLYTGLPHYMISVSNCISLSLLCATTVILNTKSA